MRVRSGTIGMAVSVYRGEWAADEALSPLPGQAGTGREWGGCRRNWPRLCDHRGRMPPPVIQDTDMAVNH